MIRPEHYEINKGISQSDLKLLKTNLPEFHKRAILREGIDDDKTRKRYFDIGDITDVMWLQPELKNEFFCMENISLGDKFKALMDELWKSVYAKATDNDIIDSDVKVYLGHVKHAAMVAQYFFNPEKIDKPWSRNLETIEAEVASTGAKYFEAMVKSNNKIVVNVQDWNTAAKCLEKITTSNNTKVAELVKYIEDYRNKTVSFQEISVFFATPFFGTYKDRAIKGLLDLVIVNHKEKWVWPVDLKTSKSLLTFPTSYRSHKYGKQGAFYTSLLADQASFKDYTIKNFGFVVVNTNAEVDDRAEYYEMSAKEMIVQTNGMTRPDGSRIRGLIDDFEDLKWHETNNEWQRYPENVKNNDVFVIETIGASEIEVGDIEPQIDIF